MMTSREDELLLALKEGHRDAFNMLYNEYYGPLLLMAYKRVKDEYVANQVVQECFVEMWEHKVFMSVQVCLKSMLCIILFRKVSKLTKKMAKERKRKEKFIFSTSPASFEVDRSLRQFLGDSDNPDDNFEVACQRLEIACHKLPPQQYATVEMIHFNHQTYQETAKSLSVTINTVKTNLRKALANLRRIY